VSRWRSALVLAFAALLSAAAPGIAADHPPERVVSEHDPIEGFNRKMFWFNDRVDVWVFEPIAVAWDFVAPRRVQTSLANFFRHLHFPIDTMNDLLQLKPVDAGKDVARFAINTTAGVLGFFDPATGWGFPPSDEDFGQTLAYWGAPSGPYLMLPILGPSNPRDTAGLAVDYAFSVTPFFVDQFILLGARVAQTVNDRSLILEEVRNVREASFDYYVAVRNAYVQRRRAAVADRDAGAPAEQEELYYPELEAP
jgi:phospholipid-binding lipoprotein MlaA